MSRVGDRVTIAGFTLGWSAVQHMPAPAAYALFNRIADTSWRRRGRDVRRLEYNLDRALGGLSEAEVRDLSRAGMRSYMRYFCDAFRLPGWSEQQMRERFDLEGKERLHAALAAGKGAVVALPHSGNWDLAGAWAALEFGGVSTVAERLKPEQVYEKFLAVRRARGIEVLPHEGAGFSVLSALSDRAGSGGLVAMLADRDLSNRGIPVEYLGGPSKLPVGPATIAVDTGAPIFSGTLWYDGQMARGRIEEQVTVPVEGTRDERILAVVQELARRFEVGVREHPEDWHMLQRVWTDEPREFSSGGGGGTS